GIFCCFFLGLITSFGIWFAVLALANLKSARDMDISAFISHLKHSDGFNFSWFGLFLSFVSGATLLTVYLLSNEYPGIEGVVCCMHLVLRMDGPLLSSVTTEKVTTASTKDCLKLMLLEDLLMLGKVKTTQRNTLSEDKDQDSAHMMATSVVPMLKPVNQIVINLHMRTWEQIHPDDIEEMDLKWQMAMLTMRAKSTRRSVPLETPASTNLVSCDGLGGYDWSDQAEEGPNYALMAYTSSSSNSKVSNDSCSKSCLETVKFLKSQNEKLLKDLEKSELMVLEDIKVLKVEIQMKDIAIGELKKKLKKAKKEKDVFQLNVDKLENTSESLNKLIECQIVDNCKKGLGYENYNAVPPSYTGNFMPLKPDLSYTGLDEFVNKPVVKNFKAKSSNEETKVVRKNNDALIIKEWVSDDEEENMTQPKIVKKTVKPSIPKIEFVKPRQLKKTARRTENHTIIFNNGGTITTEGKGLGMATDPQHTHTILQPSTSPPQQTHKPRKPKRKDTQVPQLSVPTESVADEAVYKVLDDRLVRDATTTSSLEAEQDSGGGPRCQEAMGDTIAQTRFENVSKQSNDSLLARGNTLQSDEDRMKLNALMELCTNLQTRVIDLEKTKTTQANEISSLKRRVKKLERRNKSRTHKLKRLYKVKLSARLGSSNNEESLGEDASKQERRIDDIDADEDITLEQEANIDLIETWDDVQAKIDADHQLAERLQAKEQQELTDEEKATLFMQFLEKKEKKEKRTREELIQKRAKKQKVEDDKETAELKQLMEIIPDKEEVAIYAIPLAVKEDLKDLYKLVKAKYGSTRLVEDLNLLLWGDLKTMFEPHVEDVVLRKQQGYKLLEWKLYDSCGVHSLRMQSM
nr:hypothetical protein [Tanacetum cinerariifolium]